MEYGSTLKWVCCLRMITPITYACKCEDVLNYMEQSRLLCCRFLDGDYVFKTAQTRASLWTYDTLCKVSWYMIREYFDIIVIKLFHSLEHHYIPSRCLLNPVNKLDYGVINIMFAWVGKSLIQNRWATKLGVINAPLIKLITRIKIQTIAVQPLNYISSDTHRADFLQAIEFTSSMIMFEI